MADQNLRTKVPDSDIEIENILQDSPLFVPYKVKISKDNGRGKGVENIKMNIMGSDLGMAQTKKTLTVKQRRARVGKAAKAMKAAMPKPHQTPSGGKAPQKQLATKAAHK